MELADEYFNNYNKQLFYDIRKHVADYYLLDDLCYNIIVLLLKHIFNVIDIVNNNNKQLIINRLQNYIFSPELLKYVDVDKCIDEFRKNTPFSYNNEMLDENSYNKWRNEQQEKESIEQCAGL